MVIFFLHQGFVTLKNQCSQTAQSSGLVAVNESTKYTIFVTVIRSMSKFFTTRAAKICLSHDMICMAIQLSR